MESPPRIAAQSVVSASLAAAFAQVPDPRRAGSVVYPLAAMLSLAVAAILANHHSVLAITEWGAPRRRNAGGPGLSARAHALPIDLPTPVSPA